MAKTYTDDQLPLEAIDPGTSGGPKLTHAQASLLAQYKKLPASVRAELKQQAVSARMDYISGRDIRDAAPKKEDLQAVLMNSMADSMAQEPDALDGEDYSFGDTTDDEDDPLADSFGDRKKKRT